VQSAHQHHGVHPPAGKPLPCARALRPEFPIAIFLLLVRSALSQMDVPTRTSYVMAVVAPEERPAAASVTLGAAQPGRRGKPYARGCNAGGLGLRLAAGPGRRVEGRLRPAPPGNVPKYAAPGGDGQTVALGYSPIASTTSENLTSDSSRSLRPSQPHRFFRYEPGQRCYRRSILLIAA
jgi:hypothetical protein